MSLCVCNHQEIRDHRVEKEVHMDGDDINYVYCARECEVEGCECEGYERAETVTILKSEYDALKNIELPKYDDLDDTSKVTVDRIVKEHIERMITSEYKWVIGYLEKLKHAGLRKK